MVVVGPGCPLFSVAVHTDWREPMSIVSFVERLEPSSEVRLCVSVVSSVGIGGGGGSMSTRCNDAE